MKIHWILNDNQKPGKITRFRIVRQNTEGANDNVPDFELLTVRFDKNEFNFDKIWKDIASVGSKRATRGSRQLDGIQRAPAIKRVTLSSQGWPYFSLMTLARVWAKRFV